MAKTDNRIAFRWFHGAIRYTKVPLSKTSNAHQHKLWRDRLKTNIDARICSRCRYAFISRYGYNNCSDCMKDCYDAYKTYFMVDPFHRRSPNMVRGWGAKTGFFPFPERTMNPKIPIPDLKSDTVQSSIRATFALLIESVEKDMWIVDSMPRLPHLKPYPDAPMIKDLRRRRAA